MEKRLFVAIKIKPDEKLIDSIYSFKNDLKGEKIKWVETQNIHITLKFLGETDESIVSEIKNVIENAVSGIEKFEFKIDGAGIFASKKSPRVIWFGISKHPVLKKLYEAIDSGLENLGFERDKRNFSPHLTIGRIKYIKEIEILEDLIDEFRDETFQKVDVKEVILYESILRREGPIYKSIKTFQLK